MEEEFLTVQEMADVLRVSRSMISRMAERGEIPALRLGNRWRFVRTEVVAALKEKRAAIEAGTFGMDSDPWARSAIAQSRRRSAA